MVFEVCQEENKTPDKSLMKELCLAIKNRFREKPFDCRICLEQNQQESNDNRPC